MSDRVIFLLEEPSMKAFLSELLPRLVPGWVADVHFMLIPHEGKSDLDRSIPIKLKAWREPGVRFVIVRDNDGADCAVLAAKLLKLCAGTGREAAVSLVCQELEGWYLSDPQGLTEAYPAHGKAIQGLAKRFPNPDDCLKPSVVLAREIPEFQKQDGARRVGRVLAVDRSTSASCRAFVNTVLGMAAAVAAGSPQLDS